MRFHLVSRIILALVLPLVAIGCGTTNLEPLVDGPFVVLHVRGIVQTASGEPIPGATLHLRARIAESCSGEFADGHATSDAEGSFAHTLGNWNVPRDVCVWIAVAPPAGSGVAPDTISVQPARLDFTADTLNVNIVLPASPN